MFPYRYTFRNSKQGSKQPLNLELNDKVKKFFARENPVNKHVFIVFTRGIKLTLLRERNSLLYA